MSLPAPLPPPRPRPIIERLHAYVPGEQPKIEGLIKLNTNENPYPPAPEVLSAAREAAVDRLRVYSEPRSWEMREEAARQFGLRGPEQVLFANGSDESLRMICMAWLDPGDVAATLWPTYSLYDTLVEMFAARVRHWAVTTDDPLPLPPPGEAPPRVVFLANPNPPWGTFYPVEQVRGLAEALPRTLIVVDEAYVDFAPASALALVDTHPNVLVSRTVSKSFSLAGLRLGWMIGHREVIAALEKVKDSYNVDRLAQAAGLAALKAREYYRCNAQKVVAERQRLTAGLRALGFDVPDSAGNFVFARRGPIEAGRYFQALRDRKILVRHFTAPELCDGVRITIGTPAEMDRLIEATKEILASTGPI